MITMETFLGFWGKDLTTIKVPKEIEKKLPLATTKFLLQYGLPTSERMYKERKTYLENTTPLPEIILSEVNVDRNIKRVYPFFEFVHLLSEQFRFQGQDFIRLGNDDDYYIAIEVDSGNVHYIIKNLPEIWPYEIPPPPQNQLINSGVDKLGMYLTAEFLSRRERINPLIKYVNAVNSKNYKLRDKMEETVDKIIDNLEKDFMELDDQALTANESYWRGYLYEMRH